MHASVKYVGKSDNIANIGWNIKVLYARSLLVKHKERKKWENIVY